ncbi:hypothetical protein OGAPHI_003480 [Ogataea philodendri]|uniref:Oxidoreductase-like domain-containing protein n=1 Tax=Ogataea philodendri TaxID=1378263 RepID=A0A9P8T5M6_9ASCO|nr:uncharacterized protein OGAPHI_003480 [Ogataea philodendri]KAH3666484.1 hypothetical protein OGAPHI_003480 [Ogataea philodendri]
MLRISQKRLYSLSKPLLEADKSAFYRLMNKSKKASSSSNQPFGNSSLIFETRRKTDADNPDINIIFGFSGKNKSTKSSRRDVSYRAIQRNIAGVTVPKQPIEPDNCCMSGCANCVWELYNEDLQEWKQITKRAVNNLMAQGDNIKEKWPADFDPPPAYLPEKYIPDELKQNGITRKKEVEMPLGLQVFADLEKKLKSKRSHQTSPMATQQA